MPQSTFIYRRRRRADGRVQEELICSQPRDPDHQPKRGRNSISFGEVEDEEYFSPRRRKRDKYDIFSTIESNFFIDNDTGVYTNSMYCSPWSSRCAQYRPRLDLIEELTWYASQPRYVTIKPRETYKPAIQPQRDSTMYIPPPPPPPPRRLKTSSYTRPRTRTDRPTPPSPPPPSSSHAYAHHSRPRTSTNPTSAPPPPPKPSTSSSRPHTYYQSHPRSQSQPHSQPIPKPKPKPMIPPHYSTLQITPGATHAQVLRAARKRRCEVHPDRHVGTNAAGTNYGQRKDEYMSMHEVEELAKNVGEAADVLTDPARRREYDLLWGISPHGL